MNKIKFFVLFFVVIRKFDKQNIKYFTFHPQKKVIDKKQIFSVLKIMDFINNISQFLLQTYFTQLVHKISSFVYL